MLANTSSDDSIQTSQSCGVGLGSFHPSCGQFVRSHETSIANLIRPNISTAFIFILFGQNIIFSSTLNIIDNIESEG
jgi:hypothetical protein